MATYQIGGLFEDIVASAYARALAGTLPSSGSTATYTDPTGKKYTFIVDGRYPGNIRPGSVQPVVTSVMTTSPTVAARTASLRTPIATSIMQSYTAPVAAPAPVAATGPDGEFILDGKPPQEGVSPVLIAGGVLAALALGFVAYKTLA